MADRWQKNADGILIFAGLFSASVAALLVVSVQDLRPNSQDTSAFYLANIYQVLADTNFNQSQAPIRPPVSGPPPFSPPTYAIWVNSLWFLSLVISLTCASLATSVQQWARRYLRITQPPRCIPERRARTRAFFARGVEKMRVPWAVESLPALLHLSLFLFLSGLVIFLHNVNHSVYLSVLSCVGLFGTVYGWITLMPVLWPESPYYTPLSTMVTWVIPIPFLIVGLIYSILLCAGFIVFIIYIIFLVLLYACLIICSCNRLGNRPDSAQSDGDADSVVFGIPWLDRHFNEVIHLMTQFTGTGALHVAVGIIVPRYIWLMKRVREGTAVGMANVSKINMGILDWSVVALGEDETLEKFFEAIPGFFNSQNVKDLKRHLPNRSNFIESFAGFMGRTLSSELLSEEVKARRLEICMNAADKICDSSDICSIFTQLSRFSFENIPQSIETAQLLTRLCTISKGQRLIVSCILPQVEKRDDSWVTLARDQFGLEESVLRDNIAHGDNSVLLAILLHVIRNRTTLWDEGVLSSLSRFDILNANSVLQNEFCTLWNGLVQKTWDMDSSHPDPDDLLREMRNLYIALHQGTDAAPTRFTASTPDFDGILYLPSSFPMCHLAAHHPNLADPPPIGDVDPKDVSPHPPFEGQAIPGGSTASQQAEEPTIISELPSSSDSPHLLTQAPPSPPPTADPEHITPQVISQTVPSVHESIQMVTLDPNPLVSEGDSQLSCQPSPHSADVTVDIGCPDKSTLDAPTNQT